MAKSSVAVLGDLTKIQKLLPGGGETTEIKKNDGGVTRFEWELVTRY